MTTRHGREALTDSDLQQVKLSSYALDKADLAGRVKDAEADLAALEAGTGLASGSVTMAKLADGALAASVAGRAKMAAAFFATGDAASELKFENGFLPLAKLSAATQAAIAAGGGSTSQRKVGAGQTYATIQAAVTAASAGDEILVYPGTYTESVAPAQHLNFRSLIPGAAIWVNGPGGIAYNAGSLAALGRTMIDGFDLRGGAGAFDTPFSLRSPAAASGSTYEFKNCTLRTGSVSGLYGYVQSTPATPADYKFTDCVWVKAAGAGTLQIDESSTAHPVVFRGCSGEIAIDLSVVGIPASIGVAHFFYCAFTSTVVHPKTANALGVLARGCTGITFGSAGIGDQFAAGASLDTERVYESPADVAGTGAEADIAHGLFCVPRRVSAWLVETTAAGEALIQGAHTNVNLKATAPITAKYRIRAEA